MKKEQIEKLVGSALTTTQTNTGEIRRLDICTFRFQTDSVIGDLHMEILKMRCEIGLRN